MKPLSHRVRSRHFSTLLGLIVVVLLASRVGHASGLKTSVWSYPESDVRLHVLPASSRAHTLLLPLPKTLWTYADVIAVTKSGRVPCRQVVIDSKLQAVEISLSNTAMRRISRYQGVSGALQVYLFRKPSGVPAVAHSATPVYVRTSQDKVTARPGTASEFLQYQRAQPTMITYGEMTAMPESGFENRLSYYSSGRSSERKYKARAAFSTFLSVPASTTVEFSVANSYCGPWYLIVDGRPVFSWGQFVRSKDGLMSKPVALQQGLHRLDFFTILSPGESMPALRMRERHQRGGFRPLTSKELFSVRTPTGVCVERRNDILSPGVIVDQQRAFACRGTDTLLALLNVQDLSEQWFKRRILKRSIGIDGEPLQSFAGSGLQLLTRKPAGNSLTIEASDALGEKRRLVLPLLPDWSQAQDVVNRLEVHDLPLLEPVDEKLSFSYRTTIAAELDPIVRTRGKVVLSQWLANGKLHSKETVAYPESPFKRRLSVKENGRAVSRLSISLELAGGAIAPVRNIYLVGPEAPLEFVDSNAHLRYKDGYAVLRRPGKPGGSSVSVPRRFSGKVALIDDFIATSRHTYDDFKLSDWDWSVLGSGVELMHVPLTGKKNSHPWLRKFGILKQVVAAKPSAVVWAVGMQDLLAGMDLRDFRSQLAFIIEVFRIRKIPLILVTLPPEGRLTEKKARACALLTKELAASCKAPVVDVYSQTRRQGSIERFWWVNGRRDLRSATPNAEGRRWFCAAVAGVFERLTAEGEVK